MEFYSVKLNDCLNNFRQYRFLGYPFEVNNRDSTLENKNKNNLKQMTKKVCKLI
jgi:hypothetical protein